MAIQQPTTPAGYRDTLAELSYVFKVNQPGVSETGLINALITGFLTDFPELAYRFYGKSIVRQLRRLSQVFDDVRYQSILVSTNFKPALDSFFAGVPAHRWNW